MGSMEITIDTEISQQLVLGERDEIIHQLVEELVGEDQPEDFGCLSFPWSSPLLADSIEEINDWSRCHPLAPGRTQ